MSEPTELERGVAAELERFRLEYALEQVHEVWKQAAKAGRRSVDKEDDHEDGSAALAIQRRESEVHASYLRYLEGVERDLRGKLGELPPR